MNYHPSNKTFYRGFSHMGDTFSKLLKEGGSLISKNYSSISYDKEIPKNFINENVGCCVLSFKIPMDIKSFDFEPLEKKHKHLENEKEILLERNIEFEIVDKINGIYIAKLKKYDPFQSKELKEIQKIKKELEKMKKDNQKKSVIERDINEFIKNDYDGGSLDDAYLDFEMLYTVNEDDEELIKKILAEKINKKGGRKKRKMKGGSFKNHLDEYHDNYNKNYHNSNIHHIIHHKYQNFFDDKYVHNIIFFYILNKKNNYHNNYNNINDIYYIQPV